jgi:hypothetical protein
VCGHTEAMHCAECCGATEKCAPTDTDFASHVVLPLVASHPAASALPAAGALRARRERPGRSAAEKRDSFDHLVGAREHGRRHLEAERLRGLEIDGQFEFRGLLHGQVGGLLARENAAGVDAG